MSKIMYRQPRPAAILAPAGEDVHTSRLRLRKKKLQRLCLLGAILLSLLLSLWLMAKLFSLPQNRPDEGPVRPLQQSISDKILRLHIRANSDSVTDQRIKQEVRDLVCAYLTDHMKADDKQEVIAFLEQHHGSILSQINTYLTGQNMAYSVSAGIERTTFPARDYGDFVLPAGCYDAFCIELGSGTGQNWWCILFPQLCVSRAAVRSPETIRAQNDSAMQSVLSETEYRSVKKPDRQPALRLGILDTLRRRMIR